MASQALTRMSMEEYLEAEQSAEFHSEFLNGEVFPMELTTGRHALIIANVIGVVKMLGHRHRCQIYAAPMVQITPTGLYTYADAIIVCGQAQYSDPRGYTILNPKVIFEVLSKSTGNYDLGEKFAHYRTIPTFAEYIAIAQKQPRVEQHVRQPDGRWVTTYFETLDRVIKLDSVDCEIPMAQIYDAVEFD